MVGNARDNLDVDPTPYFTQHAELDQRKVKKSKRTRAAQDKARSVAPDTSADEKSMSQTVSEVARSKQHKSSEKTSSRHVKKEGRSKRSGRMGNSLSNVRSSRNKMIHTTNDAQLAEHISTLQAASE